MFSGLDLDTLQFMKCGEHLHEEFAFFLQITHNFMMYKCTTKRKSYSEDRVQVPANRSSSSKRKKRPQTDGHMLLH